ncbi:MAG: hypothetical protein ACJARP_003154 [Vicingaceae bacterium]|jgi:hypothetical protein
MRYAIVLLLSICSCSNLLAQRFYMQNSWPQPSWHVLDVAYDSTKETIYLVGDFTSIGPTEEGGALLDYTTGVIDFDMPNPNGTVNSVVADGNGGWYIGGSFTKIGDSLRKNFGHIDVNGKVTSINIEFSDYVEELKVIGNTLYACGAFRNVSDSLRNKIVAIDLTTEKVTNWNPSVSTSSFGYVRRMVVSGNTVYLGGYFNQVGGQVRNNLAAINAATGALLPWNPNADDRVNELKTHNNKLYASGNFGTIGAVARGGFAEFDLANGSLTGLTVNVDRSILTIAFLNDTMYLGGSFTQINGTNQPYLAALNLKTETLNNWSPVVKDGVSNGRPSTRVSALEIFNNQIFISGFFGSIGSQKRKNVASIDLSGQATSWNPVTSESVRDFTFYGNNVYVGGDFKSIGGELRGYGAAINAITGELLPWNPKANEAIHKVALIDSKLYLYGEFTELNEIPRNSFLAEVDDSIGVANSWQPVFNGLISVIKGHGNSLFIGGIFDTFEGVSRKNIVEINKSSKQVLGFNADINNSVNDLFIVGNTMILQGDFTQIGTFSRNGLAKLDLINSSVDPFWEARIIGSGNISTAYLNDSNLFFGGNFSSINWQPRNNLASINFHTGVLSSWSPNPNRSVQALGSIRDSLYVGGSFDSIAGQKRFFGFAEFDINSGALSSFELDASMLSTNFLGTKNGLLFYGKFFSFNIEGNLSYAYLSTFKPTSINELFSKTEDSPVLTFYPNPCKQVLTIDFGDKGKLIDKIQVFKANGVLELEKNTIFSGQQIFIPKLPSGIYFLRVISKIGITTKPLIITN